MLPPRFNSGTNLLWKLLRMNCVMPRECETVTSRREANYGDISRTEVEVSLFSALRGTPKGDRRLRGCVPFLVQVPWGKHNPVAFAKTGRGPAAYAEINASEVLPVVVVKDPYTWAQSMCRNPYSVVFERRSTCPSPLGTTTVPWPSAPRTYESLPHLWAAWHRDYLDFDEPRLLLRYEDLLWRPRDTLERVCACVGGRLVDAFDDITRSAKDQGHGHDATARSSRSDALQRYANRTLRYEHLTRSDLAVFFAQLNDTRLVRDFGYEIAPAEGAHLEFAL